jgi:hypothetical protein
VPALAGFAIECRARLHVVTDVGNRNDHLPATARAFAVDRIVEVARILAVDRHESRERRSSRPSMALAGMRGPYAFRLGEDLRRKLVRQAVRVDRDLGFHTGRAVIAEHARDPTDRLRIAARRAA